MADDLMGSSDESAFVSTGRLPTPDRVDALVRRAYEEYAANAEGENSRVYPALASVDRHLFGICLTATGGRTYAIGDADYPFAIMSVSKPFMFALISQEVGPAAARERIGVNSTGLPFNSLTAIERSYDGRTNPMVNAGAIVTTSLVPGGTVAEKWRFIQDGLSRFAGHRLELDEAVYASAMATNYRNRSMAALLYSLDQLGCDPAEAIDLYTRQCCLTVSARDLSVMGATLAGGGVNPLTKERVVESAMCHAVLTVMATAGLYETSGDWLYQVGLPGKSGIGGGIVTVAPGKGSLGTFAPPLDQAGNSVKGQLVARYLSRQLGLDLFNSAPNTDES